MNVDEGKKVRINFEAEELPKPVRTFRPLVFMDGDEFCCVLGPNPTSGIFGRGKTIDEAFSDWQDNLNARVATNAPDDEVVQYVIDMRNTSVDDVW